MNTENKNKRQEQIAQIAKEMLLPVYDGLVKFCVDMYSEVYANLPDNYPADAVDKLIESQIKVSGEQILKSIKSIDMSKLKEELKSER